MWLARHGETVWNREGRYQGRLESDLTELGRRQAAAIAERFAAARGRGAPSPERIVCSPLRRARATAEIAGEALGLPVEEDARLVEIAHGPWEGRLKADVARDDSERLARWREQPEDVSFPGGESLADVRDRWNAALADLVADGRPTLAVTHDVVIRVALLGATAGELGDLWRMRVENGAISTFEWLRDRLGVVEPNATEHLAGLHVDPADQAL